MRAAASIPQIFQWIKTGRYRKGWATSSSLNYHYRHVEPDGKSIIDLYITPRFFSGTNSIGVKIGSYHLVSTFNPLTMCLLLLATENLFTYHKLVNLF